MEFPFENRLDIDCASSDELSSEINLAYVADDLKQYQFKGDEDMKFDRKMQVQFSHQIDSINI